MAPKPTTAERRATLLRTPDVASWYKDHGKPGTAITQLDQLEIFLRRTDLGIADLVTLAKKPKDLKETVGEFVRAEQAAGRKAKYILNVWWGVRSFLRSIGAAPEWNPKVEKTEADEEDAGRVVPTHDQLRQIVNAVKSARDRAVVYLLASSGIRIGVLGNTHGAADGLRLKHLPDLKFGDEPGFAKLPFAIRIPAHLSKGKNAYYAWGSHEAADAVIAMLKERVHGGEVLTPESPLIQPDTRGRASERRAKDGSSFMARKALAERVKLAINRVAPPGVSWSAHTLRAWFSTQLESCESKGQISRTRREFFMGHSLGTDGAYNVERPLSPEKLDELRASYARVEPALSLAETPARTDDLNKLLRALLAPLVPVSKLEGDLTAKSDAEIAEIAGIISKKVTPTPTDRDRDRPAQKAVPIADVPRLLGVGWECILKLDNLRVIMRPPASGPIPGAVRVE
ncbi:MAG: hypothetical protein ACYDFT_00825 [Thermoplasmata archaeon]